MINFEEFFNDISDDGFTEIDGGGILDIAKKLVQKKVIFLDINDVTNWNIFNVPDKNTLINKLKISNISFNKNDLYKQLHGKAYSCFTFESKVTLIELAKETIKSIPQQTKNKIEDVKQQAKDQAVKVKQATEALQQKTKDSIIAQKDKEVSTIALKTFNQLSNKGKANFINHIIETTLTTKNQAVISNINTEQLQKLIALKQSGGGFPHTIQINKLSNPIAQYKEIIAQINAAIGTKKINSCIVINESPVGKDKLELLLL